MATFTMTIMTPSTTVLEKGAVEFALFPGHDGAFGVMAHHTPLVAGVRAGTVRMTSSGKTTCYDVTEGVVKVGGNEVLLLVNHAEPAARVAN